MVYNVGSQDNSADFSLNINKPKPFFLKNLHHFLSQDFTTRHLYLKNQVRVNKSQESFILVKIFEKRVLKIATLQDFYNALSEKNIELIFAIVDGQRFTKEDREQIELALTTINWSAFTHDLNFVKLMLLIQFTINPQSNKIINSLNLQHIAPQDRESLNQYFNTLFNPTSTQIEESLLTEEDMQKIDDSSFLRNLLYRTPQFVRLMAQNHIEIKWFEEVYKVSPASFKSQVLEEIAIEDKNIALIEILTRNPSDFIFNPDLYSLKYYTPFKEIILPRLDPKLLLLHGQNSSIQYYFLGSPPSSDLMSSYLQNPHFKIETFKVLFPSPPPFEDLSDYHNAHQIMKYRPELMVKILQDNAVYIDLDDRESYFDIHMDDPQPTARFNLDLVEFCFPGTTEPPIVHDLFHFKNYQQGDIQRLVEKYPDLRSSIFAYRKDLKNISKIVVQDVIRLYLEDFERRDDTLPTVLLNMTIMDLIDLIPPNLPLEQLSKRNIEQTTLFDLTIAVPLSSTQQQKLLSLGNYSDLFNCHLPLFDFLLKDPEVFEEYLRREPHLIEFFQKPFLYESTQPDAIRIDANSTSIQIGLMRYSAEEINLLIDRGFLLDPFEKDRNGNTFFHLHPSFLRGLENGVQITNNFGETPLWNPSSKVVLAALERGADPTHRSNDGSIFLHSIRFRGEESQAIVNFLKQNTDFNTMILQTNNKGQTALEKLLEVERPFLLTTLQLLNIEFTPPIKIIVLNQIIRSEETYRENQRAVPLSTELKDMKELLLKDIVDNFENYRGTIQNHPFIFNILLLKHPHLFTQEELIEKLSNNPPKVLIEWFFSQDFDLSDHFRGLSLDQLRPMTPLMQPDQIKDFYQNNPIIVSYNHYQKIEVYVNEIVNFLNTLESDWIGFFNTTQEELKIIPSDFIASLTLNRQETILRLLPYFHRIQLVIIIPLLPPDVLMNILKPLPLGKKAEYLQMATNEQKHLFIQSFSLIPEDFQKWDKSLWVNRSFEEFVPKYQSLNVTIGIKKLKEAFLKNLREPDLSLFTPMFEEAEQRIQRVQIEIKEVLNSLKPPVIEIPDEFLDPFTYEQLENPIKFPQIGNEEPRWFSEQSWIKYQNEPQNYLTKVGKVESQVPEGYIRHPFLHTPVKIEDFKPDPLQAQRLRDWKKKSQLPDPE